MTTFLTYSYPTNRQPSLDDRNMSWKKVLPYLRLREDVVEQGEVYSTNALYRYASHNVQIQLRQFLNSSMLQCIKASSMRDEDDKRQCYNQRPSESCSRKRLLNISSDFIIRFASPHLNIVSNQWRSQEASDQWNSIQARTYGTHSITPAFSVF